MVFVEELCKRLFKIDRYANLISKPHQARHFLDSFPFFLVPFEELNSTAPDWLFFLSALRDEAYFLTFGEVAAASTGPRESSGATSGTTSLFRSLKKDDSCFLT